jgi:hypothetical protein
MIFEVRAGIELVWDPGGVSEQRHSVRLSPLQILLRTCNRAISIGFLIVLIGCVIAVVLPARDLPFTLAISVLGVWLACMGLWGRQKAARKLRGGIEP